MVVVSDAKSGVSERVDAPSVVADRLEAFGERGAGGGDEPAGADASTAVRICGG